MTVSHIAVVIPINNEEQLLGGCLEAIAVALRAHRSAPDAASVHVIGVLDACSDRSAGILDDWPFVDVVTVDHRNVGRARAAGIRHAMSTFTSDTREMWIANTDADSRVPTTWLKDHASLAAEGFDLVIGGIRPAARDLTVDQLAAWKHRDASEGQLRSRPQHVHGANLGFRADLYVAVEGFRPLTVGEDVDLVERLRSKGARAIVTAEARVETSARTVGRTPGGYADFVRLHY